MKYVVSLVAIACCFPKSISTFTLDNIKPPLIRMEKRSIKKQNSQRKNVLKNKKLELIPSTEMVIFFCVDLMKKWSCKAMIKAFPIKFMSLKYGRKRKLKKMRLIIFLLINFILTHKVT